VGDGVECEENNVSKREVAQEGLMMSED